MDQDPRHCTIALRTHLTSGENEAGGIFFAGLQAGHAGHILWVTLYDIISFEDPFNFDTAPDPDPRIRFVERRILLRLKIEKMYFFSSDYQKDY